MEGEYSAVPLGELFSFSSGLSKPAKEFGYGNPFVTFKDVFYNSYLPDSLTQLVNTSDAEIRSCSVKRGDVFLTRTSETLDELGMSSVALKDYPKATFNGFTKRLRPKVRDTTHPEYLAYAFRSPGFRRAVDAMATLSTRASLNNEMLAQLTIPLPDKDVQIAIGNILYGLDRKITLNREISETVSGIAQSLFKSWFIDFDPVRAKAEGRTSGLPREIEALFPSSLVPTQIGDIPEGWQTPQLAEVLCESTERIGSIDAPEYSSTNHGLQLRSERFQKALSASSANNKLIRSGSLIFGLSRKVLNFGLMRDEIGSVSAAYKVYEIDQSVVPADFLERLMRLQSNHFYNAVSASSREGQSITTEGLGLLRFVQPSQVVLNAFYAQDQVLTARLRELEVESRTLSALRDTILPKLISGELRIDPWRFS